MTCTLSIGPDQTLSLRTPSGREILVPVGPHSTQMLWQILWNSAQSTRELAGHRYATEFPQQAIIDAWVKDVMPERRAEMAETKRQEYLDKFGFDLKEIDL